MVIWYLSFAGDDRWLGCIHTEAPTFIEAVERTHLLGINPGGEVMGYDITRALASNPSSAEEVRRNLDILLSRAETERLFGDMVLMPRGGGG